jgi:murein DD-endopeptidase MepM/ murein hydrolase activator NlpD
MDIIVISHKRGRTWRFNADPRNILAWLPIALGVFLFCGLSFSVGYLVRGDGSVLPADLVSMWAREVGAQRGELAKARTSAEENASAMSRRIAQLQAHIIRLDAAGQRLTEIAGLEAGEFDFANPPPIGGPEVPDEMAAEIAGDPVLMSLDAFERKLSDRERQMRVLEDLLLASRLQQQVKPSGWPVENGYISSVFGWRNDPFNGRMAMHAGIDFAGRQGSDVLSVATGIVTEAADRQGYGRLIEINHGNGYVTRYGHNQSLLVKIGDRVIKGQRIAKMGNSGRSTGPHVHFEVLLNGRTVNPAQYIQAAR